MERGQRDAVDVRQADAPQNSIEVFAVQQRFGDPAESAVST
jgi:hypothetical protein